MLKVKYLIAALTRATPTTKIAIGTAAYSATPSVLSMMVPIFSCRGGATVSMPTLPKKQVLYSSNTHASQGRENARDGASQANTSSIVRRSPRKSQYAATDRLVE